MSKIYTMKLRPYHDVFKAQLIAVWEKSVRATHHFLAPADIDYYKQSLTETDFNTFNVYCLIENKAIVGFIGVANQKIEMLFLSPNQIGKGQGRKLVSFAIEHLQAKEVDVNEQNGNAFHFYIKLGFVQYDRTETDGAGKPYPIIKMRLENEFAKA